MTNLKSEMFQKLTKNEESLIFGGARCGDTKTKNTKGVSEKTGWSYKDVDSYEYQCEYDANGNLTNKSWVLVSSEKTYG